eukprot:m.235635 g.235635  ORF g.235635 m.235635 type:complete len:393 (-) comp33667_c0_seq1:491-1669(-)
MWRLICESLLRRSLVAIVVLAFNLSPSVAVTACMFAYRLSSSKSECDTLGEPFVDPCLSQPLGSIDLFHCKKTERENTSKCLNDQAIEDAGFQIQTTCCSSGTAQLTFYTDEDDFFPTKCYKHFWAFECCASAQSCDKSRQTWDTCGLNPIRMHIPPTSITHSLSGTTTVPRVTSTTNQPADHTPTRPPTSTYYPTPLPTPSPTPDCSVSDVDLTSLTCDARKIDCCLAYMRVYCAFTCCSNQLCVPTKMPATFPSSPPSTNIPSSFPSTNIPSSSPSTNIPSSPPSTNIPSSSPSTNIPSRHPFTKSETSSSVSPATQPSVAPFGSSAHTASQRTTSYRLSTSATLASRTKPPAQLTQSPAFEIASTNTFLKTTLAMTLQLSTTMADTIAT